MSLWTKVIILKLSLFLISINSSAWGNNTPTQDTAGSELQDELRFLRAELVTIETASGTAESLLDAPATMVVVTAEEIKQRGYTHLSEVLMDLPGFDVITANGTAYTVAYQRGYRTPYTTRTLFMINGIVDNLLWSHEAAITRQYPLSNIKKIEVLYGPASAVYGPNAFLGVINIITYDGTEVKEGQTKVTLNMQTGSYNSKGIDAAVTGKPTKDITFSLAGKVFKSDEPNLSNRFGFLDATQFSDSSIWGPLLNLTHENQRLGSYYDPTDDYGIWGDLHYKDLKLGLIHWKRKEAYGPYYAADRVQNNVFWNKDSDQFFVEYEKNITDFLKSHSLLLYRDSRIYGYWAESIPSEENFSYISFTQWNSNSNSWLFKQDLELALRKNLLLSGGFKFERKELTKAYDIPGYWEPAVSSSAPINSGIGRSTDLSYTPPSPPLQDMPEYNLAHPRDIGGYIQGILDLEAFRFNLGIRYDQNSMYGDVLNPRLSVIHRFSDTLTFKLLYGEAFQEPPPLLLWGGWNGRQSNPDLNPEQAQNIEFIAMQQMKRWFHEISFYYAHYTNVIKEEAENAGERDIYGIEYRAKSSIPHFLANSKDITAYFNYTFTYANSSMYYDHLLNEWQLGDTQLGDIAPHKFNIGLNIPLGKPWNLNLRGHFVGERELYTRNPLRAQGQSLSSYFTLDGNLIYHYEPFDLSFKVLNILDKDYFQPGTESATSGNDFSQRSTGFMNSIIPQPGRSIWFNLGATF